MTASWLARLIVPDRRREAEASAGSAPIFPWAVRRDVLILVALKLAVLAAIYGLFVAPQTRPEPRPADVVAHLLDR
jgi:hypothetical protein